MNMQFTEETLKKAKAAKSAAELLAVAKENNFDITENQAIEYFSKLNGELADEELEMTVGGNLDGSGFTLRQCPYCNYLRFGGKELLEHIQSCHPERFAEWYEDTKIC